MKLKHLYLIPIFFLFLAVLGYSQIISTSKSSVTISESLTWRKSIIITENPFSLDFDLKSIIVNMDEKSLEIDGRFTAIEANGSTVPTGNKYFGFTFNAELSGGDLWYRDYGSSNIPIHKNGGDFSHIGYKCFGNRCYNHIYYIVFPTIPDGTDKEFKLKFYFNEKPHKFIAYFGSGSTAVEVTEGTTDEMYNYQIYLEIDDDKGIITIANDSSISDWAAGGAVDSWPQLSDSLSAAIFATGASNVNCQKTFDTPLTGRIRCRSTAAGYKNSYETMTVFSGENYFDYHIYSYSDNQANVGTFYIGTHAAISDVYCGKYHWTSGDNDQADIAAPYICQIGRNDLGDLAKTLWVTWDRTNERGHTSFAADFDDLRVDFEGSDAVQFFSAGTGTFAREHWWGRVGWTDDNSTAGWDLTQVEWNKFNQTPLIVNTSQGCVKGWLTINENDTWAGDRIGCEFNSSGQVEATITPETTNITKIIFHMNLTTGHATELFVFNNTASRPSDTDLCYHLVNSTGSWNYTTEGKCYSATDNNTQINDADSFNMTGIHDDGTKQMFFFELGFHSSQYIYIGNISLALLPDTENPEWTNNLTNVTCPLTFTENGQAIDFQVSWTDNEGMFNSSLRENSTGSFVDHLMSNATEKYYYNLSSIPAGLFVWQYVAYDVNNNANTTIKWNCTINKKSTTINMSINGTYTNQTYDYGESSNITGWDENNEASILLARDYVSVVNPLIRTEPVGTWKFDAYLDSQNYSATNVTHYLIINPLASSITLYLNGTRNNRTYDTNQSINLTSQLIPATGTINIYRDDLLWDSGSSPLENVTSGWGAGIYKITANFSDTNYTTSNETWYATFICYTITCNSTNVGCYGCVGYDLKYVAKCSNNSLIYEWNDTGRTYCADGCYRGRCQNKTIKKYNICSVNQTKCGGIESMYKIPCQDNDGDGYYNWEWNTTNWVVCNYSCFAGECIALPEGSVFGACSDGESMCMVDDLVYCRDINNDGLYEWDTSNVTRCDYQCIEELDKTSGSWKRVASCKDEPPGYAYDFQRYVSAIGIGFNRAFDNPADKFSFMLFLMIGIGSLVTYNAGHRIGTISVVMVIIFGSVAGWIPIYASVILLVISMILFLTQIEGGIGGIRKRFE